MHTAAQNLFLQNRTTSTCRERVAPLSETGFSRATSFRDEHDQGERSLDDLLLNAAVRAFGPDVAIDLAVSGLRLHIAGKG